MSPENFVYWLQGFFELMNVGTECDMEGIHPEQARIIRDHLQLIFDKKTPDRKIDYEKVRDGLSKKKRSTIVYDPFVRPKRYC